MRRTLSAVLFVAVLGYMHSTAFAAELLYVKPNGLENAVSVDISADIAMTYTYYNVPGKARAVVDIANVDPEKVEPLIVVNRGAVANISVDKALSSGVDISRIIFNLTSESDISVTAAPDRKLLTVTFRDSATDDIKPEPKPARPPEPVATVAAPAIATAAPPAAADKEEAKSAVEDPAANAAATSPNTAATGEAPLPAATKRIVKLEPVVPVSIAPANPIALTVQKISTGASYIDIRTNQPISDYNKFILSSPERLVIDIQGTKINQKPKTIPINKFGITKARIGISPKNIRIVLDSSKAGFPAYTITSTEEGLRINFK